MTRISARTRELLGRFDRRLSVTTFTMEGIPPSDEISLTKDIWDSLSESERNAICKRIIDELKEKYGTKLDMPCPTPYAMRLTHRYLDIMNRELRSAG